MCVYLGSLINCVTDYCTLDTRRTPEDAGTLLYNIKEQHPIVVGAAGPGVIFKQSNRYQHGCFAPKRVDSPHACSGLMSDGSARDAVVMPFVLLVTICCQFISVGPAPL